MGGDNAPGVVLDGALAELIEDDGDFLLVLLVEHVVEQGGLARAQISGDDGDRHLLERRLLCRGERGRDQGRALVLVLRRHRRRQLSTDSTRACFGLRKRKTWHTAANTKVCRPNHETFKFRIKKNNPKRSW